MNVDQSISPHHRRSIRLKGYDYSTAGLYFVTVCTEKKVCLFGDVIDNEMRLNEAGQVVVQEWNALPERFPNVQLDCFVVMPNHMHGVIAIFPIGKKGAASSAPTKVGAGIEEAKSGRTNAPPSLGKIMRAFKSISAIDVNKALAREGHQVWQRNYFEHIIRGGDDLDRVRRYIIENPWHWENDEENPEYKAGQTESRT
jgi:putative transposase